MVPIEMSGRASRSVSGSRVAMRLAASTRLPLRPGLASPEFDDGV